MLLPVAVFAVPTGTAVSAVSNNNATFTANSGSEATAWFQYGMTATTLNVWTPSQSVSGGSYTWTEISSPLTSGETYWVAGCDGIGCDPNPVEFTLQNATPLPATTFGYMITNATQNKFNTLIFLSNLMLPFTWLLPQSAAALAISIVTALVLFSIYYGYAVRTRGVAVPIILGIIGAPYLLYQNQGLNMGIPVEFQAIAQGIFYASVTGIVLIILRK
jgi:hypothetical protein